MNTKLAKIISESRSLIKHATPEQKIKLLRLIKESLANIKKTSAVVEDVSSNNSDYISEK